MKKLTTSIILLLSFFSQLHAQDMDDWSTARKSLLFEKVYLHVDRELYAPGDPIWMKVYQVNGITHQLNTNFRNIYVQLLAEDGRLADELLLFSIDGQAQGMFNTKMLANGQYTIRAYTKYLENFGEEACFHKKVWITRSVNTEVKVEQPVTDYTNVEVAFLPEGGAMALNAANTLAFKAIDQKGKGVDFSGKIVNEEGETIISFKSTYKGMGKLIFMPVDGSTYYAMIDQNPAMKIKLPTALPDAIHLTCRDNGESMGFTMSANMNGDVPRPFYFMASHKGTEVSRKIVMEGSSFSLNLNKDMFPEGISKITLLDTLMLPFAERLVYVSKGEADLISLQLSKKVYKPREIVSIRAAALLSEGDSLTSTLSVTVVNQNYFGTGGNSQNIKSYLLLDSELKGGIESPASYFTDDIIPMDQKLDLLMMVNGWRTYQWDEVEATKNVRVEDWNDAGIEIKGFVKKLLWKAPLDGAELELGYVYKDFKIGKTTTNSNGRFRFERIFFQDSTEIMLNGQTRAGTRNLEIILDPQFTMDSVVAPALWMKECSDIYLHMNFYRDNAARELNELTFNPESGTILLDGIDIVQKKELAFSRSLGEYPWADRTLTITPADYSYNYLIDYLMAKIPSLAREMDSFVMRNRPVDFLIDNLVPDIRDIDVIRMKDVEIVDILDPGFRSTTPGSLGVVNPNGLIAVFRLDGHKVPIDYFNKKGRIRPDIKGFHKPVKFYAPSYTPDNINSPKPDFRPTLLWNPALDMKSGKANIDFYTSDELADYVVFVEGITKNGKICFGTTSFKVERK